MNGRGFTPGPWKVETLGHSLRVTKAEYDDDNDDIAIVGDVRNETDVATARLIAAAPELLDAVKGLLNTDQENIADIVAAEEFARAAVAKATGERP